MINGLDAYARKYSLQNDSVRINTYLSESTWGLYEKIQLFENALCFKPMNFDLQ